MTFDLKFAGHAGPGMEPNGEGEIAAVRVVIAATRAAFLEQGLELGYVECNPTPWLADAPELLEPQFQRVLATEPATENHP